MKVGAMDSRNLPPLKEARIAKRYQIGNYLFIEFFDIPKQPAIVYLFALLVLDLKTEQPVLCITSERTGELATAAFNKMMKGIGENLTTSDSPFFCVVGRDSIHKNLGSSSDWDNQKKFFIEAQRYAVDELGLDLEHSQIITKQTPRQETGDSYWPAILGLFFFAAIIGAYLLYKSEESPEQKRFMLGCLGSHNENFCERLWEKKNSIHSN